MPTLIERWRWTMPHSPVKDKNYNLINVLHLSLENAWRMEHAAAECEGDSEPAG